LKKKRKKDWLEMIVLASWKKVRKRYERSKWLWEKSKCGIDFEFER
jgi:hypothetical protein